MKSTWPDAWEYQGGTAVPSHWVLVIGARDMRSLFDQFTDARWFHVRQVGSLEAGLMVLRRLTIDAVILVLDLADATGADAIQRVAVAARGAAVAVVADDPDAIREPALAAGAEDVFGHDAEGQRQLSRSVLYVLERNRARAQQHQLEKLLDANPDAMMVVSRSGAVRYVNRAAQDLFERRPEDFASELIGFSVSPGASSEITVRRRGGTRVCELRVAQCIWRHEVALVGMMRDVTELRHSQRIARVQSGLTQRNARLVHRLLDEIASIARGLGMTGVANAVTSLLHAPAEDPPTEDTLAEALLPFEAAFRGYVDAHARLEAQHRELAAAKVATEAANRELEAFSYSVAHDLRAPLRAISGYSRALEEDSDGRLDSQCTGYLHEIVHTSVRMGRLIDDLLALSRVTRTELRRETIDLSRLAEAVASRLAAAVQGRNATVRVEPGLIVDADRRLLEVALENLLGNAYKFSGGVPAPAIEVGRRDGAVFVRDNGAGFEPRDAEKLFTPFQRLHAASEFEGSGIGLSIVQRIIARHGGRVWAEGEVGQGAIFYFTLGEP